MYMGEGRAGGNEQAKEKNLEIWGQKQTTLLSILHKHQMWQKSDS